MTAETSQTPATSEVPAESAKWPSGDMVETSGVLLVSSSILPFTSVFFFKSTPSALSSTGCVAVLWHCASKVSFVKKFVSHVSVPSRFSLLRESSTQEDGFTPLRLLESLKQIYI